MYVTPQMVVTRLRAPHGVAVGHEQHNTAVGLQYSSGDRPNVFRIGQMLDDMSAEETIDAARNLIEMVYESAS
jgi:hypothetical protein